jgi:hypothetical protein
MIDRTDGYDIAMRHFDLQPLSPCQLAPPALPRSLSLSTALLSNDLNLETSRLDLPDLFIPRRSQELIHPCILLVPNPGRPIKIILDPRPHLVDSVKSEDHDATCHTRMRLGGVDRGVGVRGRASVVGGDEGSAED